MENTASLHEDTVQHADDHVATYHPKRRRASKGRSSRVSTLKVDPEVMSTAKKLVQQRPGTHLRIVDATTVMVEND